MGEVKYDKSHPAGGTPEARIASRLQWVPGPPG